MFAIVLLMLIVILILSIIFIKIEKNTKSYPPGPFSWPFIGNQILLKRLTRDYGGQHKAFMELSKRYNSDIITVNISHEKIIIVSGSKFCDMILQNEEFQGRPWNEFIKIRNMGKKQGITMNDGPEWKELRNWMMRTMRIFGFGKSEMIKMIQNQLVIFSENLNKNKLHQLKLLFVPAVINVLWNFTTGELIAFNQQQKLEYFLDLLERRSRCFDITGGLLAAFPWIRYIAPEISGYNIMCMLNKELKDFLMKIINDHKEKI
uniref:Cytochrome P450 305a1 n=1 Tax=Apis cerana TaxID=7461 RepID=V9ILU6_APICE